MKKVLLYQYPMGHNKGGILSLDYLPTITTSSFENNLYLIEIYEEGNLRNGTVKRQER